MTTPKTEHVAICPGSFDPITEGHMDVIRRASQMFEKVYVAIAEGAEKAPLFSVDERVGMARAACAELANVEVDSFVGLVVEYAQRQGAVALVRREQEDVHGISIFVVVDVAGQQMDKIHVVKRDRLSRSTSSVAIRSFRGLLSSRRSSALGPFTRNGMTPAWIDT